MSASVEVEVVNASGIHARPATTFFRAIRRFSSTIVVENVTRGGGPVETRGITQLISGLRAACGDRIRITAEGDDEIAATEGLRDLIAGGLGEGPAQTASSDRGEASVTSPATERASAERAAVEQATVEQATIERAAIEPPTIDPAPAGSGRALRGIAAAPGYAVAPVWRFRASGSTLDGHGGSTFAAAGVPTIASASTTAAAQLDALAERVRAAGQPDEAGIFEAQALMATDPLIVEEAERIAVASKATTAADLAGAVEAAAREAAATFANLEDELLAARAADVRDVGARIARILTGQQIVPPSAPSIAVADDLPPSVTMELPPGSLAGIALEAGSRTSHAAILARALGIPAVVAVTGLLEHVDRTGGFGDGAALLAAIDGSAGEVVLSPTEAEIDAQNARARQAAAEADAARRLRGRPGSTSDGRHIPLIANIGRPDGASRAIEAGAEGVGLYRTEFVFMGRPEAPTESEQVAAYRDVLTAFGPDRPVVIRLADIGGDKSIPYLELPSEDNPFLGVRGLRLAYGSARGLLLTQIRAIFRAGAESGVVPHMMAPMVATLEDVELLLELREEARAALDGEGIRRATRIVTGIMVEIPSAALIASLLAPRVDFFSIGSNDLTQYVLAADRTNGRLGSLQDALHPAVLRAIAATIDGADRAGIPVAVCGELASDPAGALVLVGLGVDELSMDAGSLDAVRLALSTASVDELESLARAALASPNAAAVRELAAPLLGR